MLRHEVKGGGDRHISNGVFLRFGFDCSKSWKNFQTNVKNKATETHVGYVISRPTLHLSANGVSYTIGGLGVIG